MYSFSYLEPGYGTRIKYFITSCNYKHDFFLISAWASSSPAFHMMYSAYKLNKQGVKIQPWCIPFPIWNQSIDPCLVLTASWCVYRFPQEAVKVVWNYQLFKNFSQFVVIYTIKGVNETDVFLKFPCLFYDLVDVDNLISGSSAFSKTNLNSASSPFMYCWRLALRTLSITFLAWEISAIVW